jgi:hypothetical protein
MALRIDSEQALFDFCMYRITGNYSETKHFQTPLFQRVLGITCLKYYLLHIWDRGTLDSVLSSEYVVAVSVNCSKCTLLASVCFAGESEYSSVQCQD